MSPLLFIIVMEEATKECRKGDLWELLYADDLVLTAEIKEENCRNVQTVEERDGEARIEVQYKYDQVFGD